uniref:NADH dehydrogenase subunit 2 n=1 Tax=Malawimonas jakobiformis TaxID=136089 RepID=Q9G860_MALJA|nr:NADH dehydrogenase subunit 2 [Malawimonas jakobiformis]AAG13717.1 NADH dehydrogenase subunit 2 [Malawimonas jakobiformis]
MNNILINLFKTIPTEIFLFISVSILILYGIINTTSLLINRYIILNNLNILVIFTLLISILLIYQNPFVNNVTFNNTFINDNFINIIKIIVLISSISSIIISLNYLKNNKINSFEYSILILFSTIAMLLMTSSYNLISIYLSIELQSLAFYVLASMKRNSEYSTEASFKYFILGVFSSGFLLLGFSILYGITGINNIEQFYKLFIINYSNIEHISLYISLFLIIISFLFKIGAAPFHMWLPDVYEGSPLSVTAFFAITPKIVILSLIIRLFIYTFYDIIEELNYIFIISSITSMALASFFALYQKKIIRLLAYSAIGHIGYILIGITSSSINSIQSSLLYIIVYIIMTINIYSIVISLYSNNNNIEIKYIKELINLSKQNPILAFSFTMLLFSMAGIPPLAGFFNKLYIFSSAINVSMYLLVFIGILTSVISAVYYIYIIRIMYFEKSSVWIYIKQMNLELSYVISITFLFIFLFICFLSPALMYTHLFAFFLSI